MVNSGCLFAHRGFHHTPFDENTIPAFENGFRLFDGVECDVRLSADGVPIVLHDATLVRTHNIHLKAERLDSNSLRAIGVPSLAEVLEVAQRFKTKTIVLDLKVHFQTLLRKCRTVCKQHGLLHRTLFLVWTEKCRVPRDTVVYIARESKFKANALQFDGIACKYDGSVHNFHCIKKALSQNISVNLYASDRRMALHMIETFGDKCTYTL